MKKIIFVLLGAVLLAGAATAGIILVYPYRPSQPPAAQEEGSTTQGMQEVVSANNEFAFDLYSALSKSGSGNIFYSPYSISAALAMTYQGAEGQTADQIRSVFHFPQTVVLEPNFAAIYNQINAQNQDYELRTGNALWVQKDYPLLNDYLQAVGKYYGGKAENLDFINQTEKSRQTINDFIAEQTNGKIEDLIPQGFLSQQTRLVLTNAIYFKGTWQWQFDASDTYQGDFKVSSSKTVKAPMMTMVPQKAYFNYADTGDLQILELPYEGGNLSMLILLPKGDLATMENNLSEAKLNDYLAQMETTKMDLISIPKFEFNSKYTLNNALSDLGMPLAFTPSADFSGMTGNRDLSIGFVVHQAYVKVDEQGTEAAAATGVGMVAGALPVQQNIFVADHPFVFLIRDNFSGEILFMGRVADPTSQD